MNYGVHLVIHQGRHADLIHPVWSDFLYATLQGADELAASDRLLTRSPDAQVWLVRIGSRYAYRFGSRQPPTTA